MHRSKINELLFNLVRSWTLTSKAKRMVHVNYRKKSRNKSYPMLLDEQVTHV